MIDMSLYIFAAFVFVLLCLFALICKTLFSKNKANLTAADDKEKKLLALYSTVEDMMDEFNDTARQANEDLKRRLDEINSAQKDEASAQTAQAAQAAHAAHIAARERKMTVKKIPKSKPEVRTTLLDVKDVLEAVEPPPAIEKVAIKDSETPTVIVAAGSKSMSSATGRLEKVLGLHEQGLNRVQIAKELGVTLAEVDLVLEIAAKKRA